MLPRHLLEKPYQRGAAGRDVGPGHRSREGFAGLGPFRFKEHVPGQRIVLERNPFYWKTDREGKPLPYLDRLVFVLRAERGRAGRAVPVGRGRHHHAFERHEFRRPPARSGPAQLRALRPRSRARLHVSLLQSEPPGEKASAATCATAVVVPPAAVPAGGFARDRPRGHRSPRLSRTGHAALGARPSREQAVGESIAAAAARVRSSGRASCFGKPDSVEGRRHAGRQGQSARRVQRRHQHGEYGTDSDRDDHPGRPEAAGDARERRDARTARPHRSAPDDARVRGVRARPGRRRCRSEQRDERLALERQHAPVEPWAEAARDAVGSRNRRVDAPPVDDPRCRAPRSACTIGCRSSSRRTCRSSAS